MINHTCQFMWGQYIICTICLFDLPQIRSNTESLEWLFTGELTFIHSQKLYFSWDFYAIQPDSGCLRARIWPIKKTDRMLFTVHLIFPIWKVSRSSSLDDIKKEVTPLYSSCPAGNLSYRPYEQYGQFFENINQQQV